MSTRRGTPGGALPHSGHCDFISRRDFLINSVPGIVITQINTGLAGEGSLLTHLCRQITTLLLGTEAREREKYESNASTLTAGREIR